MVRRRIAALLCVVFVLQMIAGGGSPLASFASELSGSRSEIMGTQSELPVSEDSAGAASGSSVEEKDASPAETASASESELLLPHAGELTGEMRLSGTIQIYGDVGQVKDEIKLRLYADGKPVRDHRPILVSVASDSEAAYQEWEYIFPKLPEMDREGDEYTYEIADIGYSKDTSDAVLFWLNQSGDKVLGTGRGRYDADDARLVYISYEEASGELVYEAGSDGESEPEGIHFQMEAESEEDEPYLSREKAVLSVSDQTWTLPRVLPVNPLTGEEISYRIRVSQKAKASDSENRGIEEAYEISCINDGERSEDNYLYDGGRLEITALPAGTYTAAGRIVWEDESDLYGFRPETADFLRVLDEEGSDVTDEVELSLEKTGDNFWNYRISGLSAGKSYQLTTALEHYAGGEEAEPVQLSVPQKDEEGKRELALPDLIKQLKTRTVRGLIDWHGWNPKTADDSLAFLQVFYGNREVTQNVEVELLSEDTELGIWGYAVSGLAEGVEYVIRPAEVEGYTTEPEEVVVSNHLSSEESPALYGLRSAQRTLTPSAGAGLLPTISMSPVADVTLTIEAKAFSENAGSSVLSQEYKYQIQVGADKKLMSAYQGRFVLYEPGKEEGIPATASEGIITLKNGQRAEIPLPSGCYYSVKQETDNAILYNKAALNGTIRKLEGDTRLDFINIEKKYVQFQKQWNDNGNRRGIRPRTDKYQEYLFLNAAVGEERLSQPEMEKLGITKEALKAVGFPKINDESSALRGENHWPIYYDGLPSTDEKGNILSYTLAERQVPGYAAAEHLGNRDSYDDVLLNTVYRDMNVTLLWRDGKNSYGTRPGSDELLARLKDNYVIYRRTDSGEETDITGEFISASSETENPGKPYQAAVVETDENQWTLCLTNLPEYDEKGLPYTYYLKGKANSPELAPEKKEGLERAFYATEYENVENYADRADGCYENGRMVYTLQGTIDFHVTKEWKDGEAKKEEAPDVSFQLLRYPEKQPNQDPKTAWQTAAFLKKYSYETKTDGKVTEVREENLPQFNEDGYKYIYFVRESLSGTNAGEYQRIVTNESGYDFLTAAGLAGNRAVIVNRRKGQISIPVTKQWVSAAYQNIDARVSLKVERSTGSEADWEVLPSEGMYLDGFSAETLTRQMMLPGLEKYDKDGYLYQYRVLEGDVYFRAQGESEYHPMMVSVDEQEGRVITLLQTTREHFPDRQYQYETITGDTGNGLSITNRLTGTTELVIEKIWAGDWSKHTKPQTLSFDVYRNDSYTGRTVTMEEPWTDGAVFKATVSDLPRYDSNGAEYNYTVQERCSEGDRLGGVSYTYERLPGSWSEDGTKFTGDAWKATVVNTPPGDGRSIRVKKKWLDGGDSFCRKPVTVELYRKLKNVENSEWEATGNYTTVSEKTDWVGWISAAGFDEKQYDYAVAETAIGNDSKTAAPEFSVAKAGEIAAQGSITTKEHYYDFESKKLDTEGTSWEITNRRTGTLSVTVQKSWVNGDASGDALPLGAEFILYRGSTEDISEQGRRKQAALNDTTISWTGLPKYDEKGKLIEYSVKEGSILAASGTETIECSVIGGYAMVHGHRYVSEVTREEYQHGSVDSDTEKGAGTYPETGDVIPYSITNRRQQQIQNFTIHKIWKDDGARRSKRPDIYFELWKEENGNLKLMEEYIGRERKEKNVANPEYHEVYVFDDIPRYTADGNEINYYAIERTHVANTLYSGISYDASPEADGTFSMEAWENYRQKEKYETMIPNNGTVVNIRSGETVVSGRKIWENMGGLTLENYPAVTLKLQRRYLYATPGESNPYLDVLKENGSPYSRVLSMGSPDYRFPDAAYAEEGSLTGYPKYDPENGREYSYYVEEASVTAGDNPNIPADGFERTSDKASFIIRNTFQTTGGYRTIVNKEWEGIPAGEEGPKVTFHLYRQMQDSAGTLLENTEENCDSYCEGNSFTYRAGEEQSLTFRNLPYSGPNGYPYRYWVTEEKVNGYRVSEKNGDDGYSPLQPPENKAEVNLTEASASQLTLKNSYDPTMDAVIEIWGTKSWTDEYNRYQLRPSTASELQLILHRRYEKWGGGYKEETIDDTVIQWTIPENGNSWTYQFTMPDGSKFARYAPNGKEYEYWVTEEMSGSLEKTYQINSASNGEKKKVSDLLLSNGAPKKNALTLNNNIKWTSLEIRKQWDDSNNLYQLRPNQVTFQIQRRPSTAASADWEDYTVDGAVITMSESERDQSPSDQNLWKKTVKLPMYDGNGTEYEYRAVESEVPAGYSHDPYGTDNTYVKDSKTSILTNHLVRSAERTSILAEKKWSDEDNRDGLRPSEVTVTLYRKSGQEWKKLDTRKLSARSATTSVATDIELGNWTVVWKNLPQDPFMKFKVVEDAVTHYTTAYATSSEAEETPGTSREKWTITNAHDPYQDVKLTVEKKWDDNKDQWKLRPQEIVVQLYKKVGDRGGLLEVSPEQKATLSQANNWKASFMNLPYGENGEVVSYTVKEVNPLKAYDVSINPEIFTPNRNETGETKGWEGSVTLTNTLLRTKLTVTKVWNNGNTLNSKATGVRLQLQRKLANKPDTAWEDCAVKELTSQPWQVTFDNLPQKDENGIEYQYRAVETGISFNSGATWETRITKTEGGMKQLAGYQITEETPVKGNDGFTQTITNTRITTDVRVKKVWDDNENQDHIRPANVTVQLVDATGMDSLENAAAIGWTVTLQGASGSENYWQHQWNNLAKYKEDGSTVIDYRIREVSVPQYYSVSYATSSDASSGREIQVRTVTNSHTPFQDVAITVTKQWEDRLTPTAVPGALPENSENYWKLRPSEVAVQLYQRVGDSGEFTPVTPARIATLSQANEWNYVFTGLTYASQGTPISYQVRETNLSPSYTYALNPECVTPVLEKRTGALTLTNSLKRTSLTVTKTWDYKGIPEGRPNAVKVTLQRKTSGEFKNLSVIDPAWTEVETKVITPDAAGTWKVTFDHLPKEDSDGTAYEYRAVETAVSYDGGSTWITGCSYENGAKILSGYLVEEKAPVKAGEVFTQEIKNTRITVDVPVKKVWNDNHNQDGVRPDAIGVQLYRVIGLEEGQEEPVGTPATLSEAEGNWRYRWSSLPKYREDGSVIQYRIREVNVPVRAPYTQNPYTEKQGGTIDADTVAPGVDGSGKNLLVNSYIPKTMRIEAKKQWSGDGTNPAGTRPDSITLHLERRLGDQPYEVLSVSERTILPGSDGSWSQSVSWEDLPVMAASGSEAVPVSYRVVETPVNGYVTTINAADLTGSLLSESNIKENDKRVTIENRLTPESAVTSASVRKVWNHGEDPEKKQIQSVTLELQRSYADDKYDSRNWKAVTYGEAGKAGEASPAELVFTVTLPRGDSGVDEKTITDLPRYDTEDGENQGREYMYRFREISMEKGQETAAADRVEDTEGMSGFMGGYHFETALSDPETDGSTVTTVKNTWIPLYTSALSGTKIWEDQENRYGLRPSEIQLELHTVPEAALDGVAVSEPEWTKNGSVWQWQWKDLPMYTQNGTVIQYSVTEQVPDGYEALHELDGTVITNTLKTGSLTVKKTMVSGYGSDFQFRAELTVNGKKQTYTGPYYRAEIDAAEGTEHRYVTESDGTIRIDSGESFRIDGIPVGASYQVTEIERSGYALSSSEGDTGVIPYGISAEALFVNRKKSSGGGNHHGGSGDPKPSEEPQGPGQTEIPEVPSETEPQEEITETVPEEEQTIEESEEEERKAEELKKRKEEARQTVENLLTQLESLGVPMGWMRSSPEILEELEDWLVALGAMAPTGDSSVPLWVLFVLLLGSGSGWMYLRSKRKKKEE